MGVSVERVRFYTTRENRQNMNAFIRFFLYNRAVVWITLVLIVAWGLMHSPFDWSGNLLPRDPVAVDAIPDLGENQQIVYTPWPGRSPREIEDQITYPLTTSLLGLPGVKSIRSTSMFGVSVIYVIFEDDVDFYWSRSRVLEKLNALPKGLLPEEVQPTLGPDATGLGQVFWYTLEGRDANGNPVGGWDLHELRSIQDYYVRYALMAVPGVAEVSSVGGFVKEYHVDLNPYAMQHYGISFEDVVRAVKNSNTEIGAKTLEINRVEYFVRGLGYIRSIDDLKKSVVAVRGGVAITLDEIAHVSLGPAERRGVLDKDGAEAVGGVVVARYGTNAMEVIQRVKEKIKEISTGLPQKVLPDGTVSQLTIVPFYDRTDLIVETLGTLESAILLQILVTVLVVLIFLRRLRSSMLISALLPLSVLMVFIVMKYTGITANIVALAGIAIAVGTMVDMGIVIVESIYARMEQYPDQPLLKNVYEGVVEVSSAVATSLATTVISFLPVFALQAAEGKMFHPLAFTKTFALLCALFTALILLPTASYYAWSLGRMYLLRIVGGAIFGGTGLWMMRSIDYYGGLTIALIGIAELLYGLFRLDEKRIRGWSWNTIRRYGYFVLVMWYLASIWHPLGVHATHRKDFLFLLLVIGLILGIFFLFVRVYPYLLERVLRWRWVFLSISGLIIASGYWLMQNMEEEFLPVLDEGAFLLMPTTLPHAGISENIRDLKLMDMSVASIPEVETVVGKIGRVESALDPAPLSMFENLILYKPEYIVDEKGRKLRFKVDDEGAFVRDSLGNLIPDPAGEYYRQWRDEIRSADDIWNEIVQASKLPGVTSAPKLHPIQTRLIMLQSGMRSPIGIKIYGDDLDQIEEFALQLEPILQEVPAVEAASVYAERIVGKPYLEIELQRDKLAMYGLTVKQVQDYIQLAVGGVPLTKTVEDRERYDVRVRFPRQWRDSPEDIRRIPIPLRNGQYISLGNIAEVVYRQGPQAIKSEDGFLVGYVLFDKKEGYSEIQAVEQARQHIAQKIENGDLTVPPGITFRFAGNYQQQQRAKKRLMLIIPLTLLLIYLLLYLHFRSVIVAMIIFSGVAVAFSGGFILMWLYGQPWFMNFEVFGASLRDIFSMETVYLSVAVWVGFLALFGIATDDGVLMATYIRDAIRRGDAAHQSLEQIVLKAGKKRIRPAVMTTVTTLVALLPVLSSTGKGSEIMIPMAIPIFGGMLLEMLSVFMVPTLYYIYLRYQMRKSKNH